MILRYTDFLLEYNNRKLHFNVVQLANKYPDFISAKYNQAQNDAFCDWLFNGDEDNPMFEFLLSEMNRFKNNKELVKDCENIGISIDYIFDDVDASCGWVLYNGKNLLICPGGGEDFLGAKILGAGVQKIAYQSKGDVLKKKEDVSTLEVYISNKYPDLFATYKLAGDLLKQEKLITLDNDINDYKFEQSEEFIKLSENIKKVFILENLKDIHLDVHLGNIGYDVNNKLKCFDFLYYVPYPANLMDLKDKAHVSQLKDYKIKNLKHEYYNVKRNNRIDNIIGLNIINNTKGEIYVFYTYDMLLPYLKDELIIFAMK